MISETVLKLPIINLSKAELISGSPEWGAVRSQVFKALEFYGSFEAVFDNIPEDVRKAAFNAAEEFFGLPSETKVRVTDNFHGYVGNHPVESMVFEHANMYNNVDAYTKRIWFEGNPNFTKSIQAYTNHTSQLDKIVRKMIIESLGVEEYMDEHMNSFPYHFIFTKYSPPETEGKVVMVPPHTDHSFLGIIHQNNVDGLAIETKSGEWVKFKPSSPHSYVVIVGELFHAWSNGRLHCPHHMVTMTKEDQNRHTLISYCSTEKDYMIETPKKLIDESHPLLYKPFNLLNFLPFLYNKAAEGTKLKSFLKAYCGI